MRPKMLTKTAIAWTFPWSATRGGCLSRACDRRGDAQVRPLEPKYRTRPSERAYSRSRVVLVCLALFVVAGCNGTLGGAAPPDRGNTPDGRVRRADSAVGDSGTYSDSANDSTSDSAIIGDASDARLDGLRDARSDTGPDADPDAGHDAGSDSYRGPDASDDGGRPSKPNILFIAIDDLNDWVGVLEGHPQARTPNIDRLAAQGLLFTNAHTAAPACNPSRVATLTGIRPSSSGVYQNNHPWRPVMPDAVTLPDHFRQHGYETLGAGKILHGNKFLDPGAWDDYYPAKCNARPTDPLPPSRPLNGIPDTGAFDWGPVEVADSAMGDHKVTEWVAGQLAVSHDRPFFLACGIFRPHLPWYVPPAYFAQHPLSAVQLPSVKADDIDDLPPAGKQLALYFGDHAKVVQYNQWHEAVQGYLAALNFADAMLGRVLDALESGPHADNTIVVLWTDHGWHLGEKQHWRKFTLWEEATRVPLIVKAPGMTRAGTTSNKPVNLVDLYPTLIELAGLPERTELEGRSLVPLLRKPNDSSDIWRVPALTTHGRANHALRDQRWRYIRYRNGEEELYDHAVDPMEWDNLIPKLQDNATARQARDRLAAWLDANVTDAPPAPTEDEYSPEELKCVEDE